MTVPVILLDIPSPAVPARLEVSPVVEPDALFHRCYRSRTPSLPLVTDNTHFPRQMHQLRCQGESYNTKKQEHERGSLVTGTTGESDPGGLVAEALMAWEVESVPTALL